MVILKTIKMELGTRSPKVDARGVEGLDSSGQLTHRS
jgi:hypothetical protein